MSGVETRTVAESEGELRLDRWFRLHYPELGRTRLHKLLRTGQVRVDGKRAAAGERLRPGQLIRVPPLREAPPPRPAAEQKLGRRDAVFVRSLVIYRDAAVIALDKPPGLAVQGGTATYRHLDAMLDALRDEGAERPRLVHRLDRDTSGVLLLGRTRAAATALGSAFRKRTARKIYWAIIVGIPDIPVGRIDLPIAKLPGKGGERMAVDQTDGQHAITWYRVIETAGRRLAWVALWPRTGRTHQLRAHCAAIGHPILGDGKYGGAAAHIGGEEVSRQLHLHAREIDLPHPIGRDRLVIRAPLPDHMRATWSLFGFESEWTGDPFPESD